MSDGVQEEPVHRRPHASQAAGPFLEFDLTRELALLHHEPEWNMGHNAKTLVKYDDIRIVLTALKANVGIPRHQAEGRVSVHVLSGHLRIRAFGRTFDLWPGSLLALDRGAEHEVEALEDSAFLLTIAWRDRNETRIAESSPGS
jgi:quercetin dioxygenase-like cupin family protein